MTKELLEQYPDICMEIELLNRPVTDTVSASSPEPPYTQHTLSIRGIEQSQRLQTLKDQKQEIEDFVSQIPVSRDRTLLTLRALRGMPWRQVAAKMKYRRSEKRLANLYGELCKKYF